MTYKELFYFTGKCLTIEEHPGFRQKIIETISIDSIDWQMFVALCSTHLILPVIYLKFKSNGILEYLPEELNEFLKEIYDLNLVRNNKILEQLHDITKVLNKTNIYPVFLKGAGNLLDKVYTDIGERILGDIDLLVPEKDYLLSAKLLENDGYLETSSIDFDYGSYKHYEPILKPGFPTQLEIHRSLSKKCKSWFNPEIINIEKQTVIALNGCYVLSDKHKIIYNFIHSQLSHDGHIYGIVSFRNLYDLYLLSKRSDLKQTIPVIKRKQKANTYFVFAGKALGLKDKFYIGSNLASRIFLKRHDLNLSSAIFYHTYRSIIYITEQIFIRYIGQAINSIYSKEVRKSLIKRLSDREWYRKHFHNTYVSFFVKDKK